MLRMQTSVEQDNLQLPNSWSTESILQTRDYQIQMLGARQMFDVGPHNQGLGSPEHCGVVDGVFVVSDASTLCLSSAWRGLGQNPEQRAVASCIFLFIFQACTTHQQLGCAKTAGFWQQQRYTAYGATCEVSKWPRCWIGSHA